MNLHGLGAAGAAAGLAVQDAGAIALDWRCSNVLSQVACAEECSMQYYADSNSQWPKGRGNALLPLLHATIAKTGMRKFLPPLPCSNVQGSP